MVDAMALDTAHRQDVIVRHLLMNPEWLVHASSQDFMNDNPGLWTEERESYERFESELKPAILPAISEITRRLNLEYYGIDCNINEQGELLIFEANANMNVLHSPNQASRWASSSCS